MTFERIHRTGLLRASAVMRSNRGCFGEQKDQVDDSVPVFPVCFLPPRSPEYLGLSNPDRLYLKARTELLVGRFGIWGNEYCEVIWGLGGVTFQHPSILCMLLL